MPGLLDAELCGLAGALDIVEAVVGCFLGEADFDEGFAVNLGFQDVVVAHGRLPGGRENSLF